MSAVGIYESTLGLTFVGSRISQWDDQSGNGNHLRNLVDINRPTLELDVFEGLPGVKFSGNEWLEAFNSTVFDFASGDFSFVVVLKNNFVSNTFPRFIQKGEEGANQLGWRVFLGSNDPTGTYSYFSMGDGTSSKRRWGIDGDILNNEVTTIAGVSDSSATYLDQYVNGPQSPQKVNYGTVSGISNANIFSLGHASINPSNRAFEGYIAELRIYDHPLSAAELIAINSELQLKYYPQPTTHINKTVIKRKVTVENQYRVMATDTATGVSTWIEDLTDTPLADGHYRIDLRSSKSLWKNSAHYKPYFVTIKLGVIESQGLPAIVDFKYEIKNGKTYFTWNIDAGISRGDFDFKFERSSDAPSFTPITGYAMQHIIEDQIDNETFTIKTTNGSDDGPSIDLVIPWSNVIPNSPTNQVIERGK